MHLARKLNTLIFLGKGALPPCNPKPYNSVSLDQKGPKLCIFSSQNIAAPLQPSNHIFL